MRRNSASADALVHYKGRTVSWPRERWSPIASSK